MTLRLPSDLMARPAEEAARILALSHLRQIGRARVRLDDPQDLEALHDFRVGLRRLRSSLRAYRVQLKGSVSEKMEGSLRKLMRATNAGRDAEVQLTWLRKQGERMHPEEAQGLFWLIGRLEGRKSESLDSTTVEVSRQFGKAAAKFRRRLGTLKVEIEPGPGKRQPTFGQVTAQAIRQHVARLEKDLKQVRSSADIKQAHRARVAIKRLRYLLEPVARRHPRARDLVSRLKETQDQLGELHDLHILSEEIAASRRTVSEGHPDHQSEPGLRSLERLAQEQVAAAFEGFNSFWGGDRASRFLDRAAQIGRSLEEESPITAHEVRTLSLPEPPAAEAISSLANLNHEHAV